MMVENFVVTKCPNNELSLKNRLIISPADFQNGYHYIFFHHKGKLFHFTCHPDARIQDKQMGFSLVQRKWAYVGIGVSLQVEKFTPTRSDDITDLRLGIDFFRSKEATSDPVDSDFLVKLFKDEFTSRWFARGESLIVLSQGCHFTVTVTSITSSESPGAIGGVLQTSSAIVFQGAENSKINLIGKSMVQVARLNIINPDFDFKSLGIGGLDEEFKEIFRRAFSTRNVDSDVIEKNGIKHVKGILLHGPPGCGKTLTARQIGKMLSVREPIVVTGPEILDKYVGESEANVRKLFEAAEEEQKKSGANSGLHIIILDEIDAICKQRGSVTGGSGVHDTVVNQLLSKIDGVDQLDNILIIGMTNRPELIDDALLRPGRLEVKKEIGLPDEQGRHQILNIHCAKMMGEKTLSDDVDLAHIASLTRNFTGAELSGVVKAACSCALVRKMKESNTHYVGKNDGFQVCNNDFMVALEHDIKPAYGWREQEVKSYMKHGILMWGAPVQYVLDKGSVLINQLLSSPETQLVSMLLHGSKGSGTTALAAQIALETGFSFVKICSWKDLAGMSEGAKCQQIKSIFADAYKSPLSCVVIDNIEKLIDFNQIGPRFSNIIAQVLTSVVETRPPSGHKLLVIATSSHLSVTKDMKIHESFKRLIHVENLSCPAHINEVLEGLDAFTTAQRAEIECLVSEYKIDIGIKQLIHIVGTAEHEPSHQVSEFMSLLAMDGGLQSSNVCKMTEEDVERYMLDGILMWGGAVQDVLDKGSLLVNQVRSSTKTRQIVSMLLHGSNRTGKTALATQIAVDSEFPFVKVCSPGDLIGLSEGAKLQHIKNVFTDAYKSELSCVVIDDIKKLMDYNPIGPRFSNTVAQALMMLVKGLPPANCKLLVIATSSNLSVLHDMKMDEAFDQLIHVAKLSKPEHINNVLESLDAFTTMQRSEIERRVCEYKIGVEIKRLIQIVGAAAQVESSKQISTFISLLVENGGLQSSSV